MHRSAWGWWEGRTTTPYRYGFNGKENDLETSTQDYGMRIYDPRVARFLSTDPISKSYPELTPYQFASNSPIFGIDRDGKELLGNNFIIDIWLKWKFGDPTGAKTLMQGATQKAMVETRQMSYHNDAVPLEVQNKLDHINNIQANAKIAAGTGQMTRFMIETSADIVSTIAPVGEGVELGIQGFKQLNRYRFAAKFYEEVGITGERLSSHLKYYDFEQKVYTQSFNEGTEFVQYRLTNSKGVGDYYAPSGTKPSEIGLDPADIGETYKVTLNTKIETLVSRHKKNVELYYDANRTSVGGGTQIYSKEIKESGNATFTKIPQ